MAEADNIGDGSSANLTAEEWERVCKVRTIRELHPVHARGREAAILLEHKGWDVMATTSFIKESDPDKLRAMIDKKGSGNRQKSKKEKQEPESSGTSPKNKTGKEPRQFACPKEKNVWWKSVPVRNPMSTCLKCGQEYEPIPKLEEWGIGEFKCICDHEFRDHAMMDRSLLYDPRYSGKSESLCHACWAHLCYPERIIPSWQRGGFQRVRRSQFQMVNRTEFEGSTTSGFQETTTSECQDSETSGFQWVNTTEGQGSRKSGFQRSRTSGHCTGHNCYKSRSPATFQEPIVSICVHPTSLGTHFHGAGSKPHN